MFHSAATHLSPQAAIPGPRTAVFSPPSPARRVGPSGNSKSPAVSWKSGRPATASRGGRARDGSRFGPVISVGGLRGLSTSAPRPSGPAPRNSSVAKNSSPLPYRGLARSTPQTLPKSPYSGLDGLLEPPSLEGVVNEPISRFSGRTRTRFKCLSRFFNKILILSYISST